MDCGSILSWALFGLIVGAIARFFWPGRQPAGCLSTIILGVAGSVVGGAISRVLMGNPNTPFEPSGLLMSIVGAIIVLWAAGTIARHGPYD